MRLSPPSRSLLVPLALSALAACTPSGSSDVCAPYRDADAALGSNHAEWMTELTCRYPDRGLTLKQIAWPRSHDTGTYAESSCLFPGAANACNTRTQAKTMAEQLAVGVRAFDVRPELIVPDQANVVSVAEPTYFTHHTVSCRSLGCIGTPLDALLSDVRHFLDRHRELVILELTHFCDTGVDDAALVTLIEQQLGDRLYREPVGETRPLIDRPLAELLPGTARRGKALVLWEGLADTAASRQAGRFPIDAIPVESGWSNTTDLGYLVQDQTTRYASYANDGTKLFELSWTLTQDTAMATACAENPDTATSIEDLATIANGALVPNLDALIASGQIRAGRIPNVISLDFAEGWVTDQCLRITEIGLE